MYKVVKSTSKKREVSVVGFNGAFKLNLIIPDSIKYNNHKYDVVGIEKAAFMYLVFGGYAIRKVTVGTNITTASS